MGNIEIRSTLAYKYSECMHLRCCIETKDLFYVFTVKQWILIQSHLRFFLLRNTWYTQHLSSSDYIDCIHSRHSDSVRSRSSGAYIPPMHLSTHLRQPRSGQPRRSPGRQGFQPVDDRRDPDLPYRGSSPGIISQLGPLAPSRARHRAGFCSTPPTGLDPRTRNREHHASTRVEIYFWVRLGPKQVC